MGLVEFTLYSRQTTLNEPRSASVVEGRAAYCERYPISLTTYHSGGILGREKPKFKTSLCGYLVESKFTATCGENLQTWTRILS
jgi:hypothetical protein